MAFQQQQQQQGGAQAQAPAYPPTFQPAQLQQYYPPPGGAPPAVINIYGSDGYPAGGAPAYLPGAGPVTLPLPQALQALPIEDDCCGCSGGGAPRTPQQQALTEPLPLAAYALQAHGGVAIGLGVLFLLSTGWSVLSAIMLIAQGGLLRASGASAAALQAALADAAAVPPRRVCCGRSRNANARGLAIAAMVFAVCECLLGLGLGLGLGISLLYQPVTATSPSEQLLVCGSAFPTGQQQCLSSVTSANLQWLRSGGGAPFLQPLVLLRRNDIPGSQYLLWAAGTTFFSGCVIIALSAHTMHLCKVVAAFTAPAAAPRA